MSQESLPIDSEMLESEIPQEASKPVLIGSQWSRMSAHVSETLQNQNATAFVPKGIYAEDDSDDDKKQQQY